MSPNGRRVASLPTLAGGPVCVGDLTTGRQIGGPLQGEHEIWTFACSRNGHSIITGDMEGNIQVWDVSLLDNVSTSTPLVPHLPGTSESSSRANSVSSSILNLPGKSQSTSQAPELNTGAGENDNWEYDTDASFDSLWDLPMDGIQPAQRRKRPRRRGALIIVSTSSPPMLVGPSNVLPATTNSPSPHHPPTPPKQPAPDARIGAKSSPLRGAPWTRRWRKTLTPPHWTRHRRNSRGEQSPQPVVIPIAENSSKSESKPSVANAEPPTFSSPPPGSKSLISLVGAHLRRDKHVTHNPEAIENASPRVPPQAYHLLKHSPVVKVSPAQAFSRIAKARPREWDKRRPRRVAPQEPGQGQAAAQGQEPAAQGPEQAAAQGQVQEPGPIQRQRTVSVRGSYEWVRQHANDGPGQPEDGLADVEVGCWDLFRAAIEYTFTRRKDPSESE